MKKLIYTVLGLLATSAAFSQSLVQGRPLHQDLSGAPISKMVRSNSTMGKAQVSDWYDPIDWLNSFTGGGGTLTTFVDFLMPDSTAIYVNEGDSIFRFYSIAVGQVIDPRDAVISLTDNPGIRLSKFNGFSLDSIYLSYLYVRNVDSIDDGMGGKNPVVDTLIIRYFTPPAMTFRTLSSATPPFSFVDLNWSIPQLSATGYVAEQKILLTRDDSTSVFSTNGAFENSWGLGQMIKATPTGISIPAQNNGSAQNVIAYTLHFKPGMPYDTSSVMIYRRNPATFPSTRKRVNYFGYRMAQNAQTAPQWRSTAYFNHSLFSDKENAYYASGTINNGWDGFLPGNAYFAGRNIFSGLRMTSTNNVGLNKINNETFAMTNVYPNPAPVNSVAVAGFNLKQNAQVKISIINLVGQEVKTVVNGSYAAGETAVDLDLNGLNSGIYFVKMTVNGVSETKKLTIGQ